MLLPTCGIIIGLFLLAYGADRFVSGAASIANHLGVSPMIIGITIVGLATSMPEVLVGTISALDNKTDIAIGNAIGSNIANITLVLGVSLLIKSVAIQSTSIIKEYSIMLVVSLLLFLLISDLVLTRNDGFILLFALTVVSFLIYRISKAGGEEDNLNQEILSEIPQNMNITVSLGLFIFGLVLLLGGAELLVKNAIIVAKYFGLSDLIIGLTIVAIGTSLPELAASISASLKNESDMMIGNIIGSNIFNILLVLSIPVLISPTTLEQHFIHRDYTMMITVSVILGIMLFIFRKNILGRIDGFILLSLFIVYQYILFFQT